MVMNKPIACALLVELLAKWRLEPDGTPFSTHTSVLMPAKQAGNPVMLKVTHEPDELRGGELLAWWDGVGAVQVIERDGNALLMERATGTRSLVQMSENNRDEEATRILCSVAAELHRARFETVPPLQSLDETFSELLTSDSSDILIRQGRAMARELIASQVDCLPLHGDLHHFNVLDTGDGRWLAIDPKGLFGERAFEFVSLFRNPSTSFSNNPTLFERRIAQIESRAGVDAARLRSWIVAFCALCVVWNYYPTGCPDADRELARLALG